MAPPGPIPNPEVKHWRVDDSRTIGPAKVDRRQDQTQPAVLTALRAAPFTLSLVEELSSVRTLCRARATMRFAGDLQPVQP